MGILACGIYKPIGRPFPGVPGLLPGHNLPANQWVQVLDWSGITVQTLVHRVLVNPPDAVIKWRRKSLLASREGTFQETADFNVYPTDTKLTIELWVDDPNVEIVVEFRGSVPWTPPTP